MNESTNDPIVALNEPEFKKKVILLIKSPEYTPELLQELLEPLWMEKPDFFDDYAVDDKAEKILETKHEWVIGGYFDRHCRFLEQNFSKKRIEHLIQVKGHLIEYGIAGFSKENIAVLQDHKQIQSEDNIMNNPFLTVDVSNVTPTRSLQKSLASGDITSIRMALFMEMNDHRLPTQAIRQLLAYVLKHKANLFVDYENNGYAKEMIKDNKSNWDAKYYALQEVYASSNFSYQRLEHMLEVREYVFAIPQHMPKSTQPNTTRQKLNSSTRAHSHQQQKTNYSSQAGHESLKAIIVIGGVLAAVAVFILMLL